uniref:Uncharacterized protein n=1 Tax=Anguilla anguilla TaxID=7936 RepID=A0A0E9XJK7_ANGAN
MPSTHMVLFLFCCCSFSLVYRKNMSIHKSRSRGRNFFSFSRPGLIWC